MVMASTHKGSPKNSIVSPEEWYNTLLQRYQNLIEIANYDLPGLWDSLEFELSIQKILNIKDCTLPFAGIVLGRPSSLKTVGIELFRKWLHTYYTDNFSARAFVSHSTAVKREALEDIDMLPKIKNKLFLTPELSPTFSKKDDELIDVLGILTRVLDGHGYESDTGAHGHRGYNESMMFTWIGAAVDIPYKVHKFLGTLGPKLYFLRLPSNPKNEDEYFDDLDKDFGDKLTRVRTALYDYLNWFELCPNIQRDKESMLGKVARDADREESVDALITEPCETLTTPDGYTLTNEGNRVFLVCIGGGALATLLGLADLVPPLSGVAKCGTTSQSDSDTITRLLKDSLGSSSR
jgi:hypothetical protein